LLLVIHELQHLTSSASSDHGNDRDPNGFEKGQDAIKAAFALCIETLGHDPSLDGAVARGTRTREAIERARAAMKNWWHHV